MRQLVADPARLYPAIDCADPAIRRFETERLMPFYRRILPQLRQVTPDAIFFLEPHIWASGGTHSFITREAVGGEGVSLAPEYEDAARAAAAAGLPLRQVMHEAAEAARRLLGQGEQA